MPSPRTEDNTAWFPVTAYRSFSDGKLIFNGSAAGYEGTNTIAKNGNNYRIYYTKIAAGELSTPNNAWGMIGEPYPFRCVKNNNDMKQTWKNKWLMLLGGMTLLEG